MKIAIRVIQIVVGLLFIISGLVKANDPIGLGYKMQEFFELWSAGFTQRSFLSNALQLFHDSSLALSIIMITLEIFAGVALLVGWRKKMILWLLFLLIIFFTFLTGYAYLSGKFTNCGCFGDCLPITPLTSFIKDILLLVLIALLLAGQKHITPVSSKPVRTGILIGSLLVSLGLQWYVLNYLPVADCLPFKKGNNISEQLKPPLGSRPDSVVIKYIYEKQGKRYEWAATELPADFSSYKYVDRIDKVVRKGNADPALKGFSLVGISGVDSTEAILAQPVAILAFAIDFENNNWLEEFKQLTEAASSRNRVVYLGTSNAIQAVNAFQKAGISNTAFFNVDFTAVRTVARTTPTILLLKGGTIVRKYSKSEIGDASEAITNQRF
jgi:uncharacterized membrane protein YphA (DoxX/SURF4 family)